MRTASDQLERTPFQELQWVPWKFAEWFSILYPLWKNLWYDLIEHAGYNHPTWSYPTKAFDVYTFPVCCPSIRAILGWQKSWSSQCLLCVELAAAIWRGGQGSLATILSAIIAHCNMPPNTEIMTYSLEPQVGDKTFYAAVIGIKGDWPYLRKAWSWFCDHMHHVSYVFSLESRPWPSIVDTTAFASVTYASLKNLDRIRPSSSVPHACSKYMIYNDYPLSVLLRTGSIWALMHRGKGPAHLIAQARSSLEGHQCLMFPEWPHPIEFA